MPALSAMPKAVRLRSPMVRHVTERHGALPANQSVFDEIEGILTATEVVHRASTGLPVDVRMAEVFDEGEELIVEAVIAGDGAVPLEVRLIDEAGSTIEPHPGGAPARGGR